ncbi:hypothetical protein HWV62_5618 [Athelia sp. TMB]|nr:hypothetical protein HWV62_5618 [Athelia sp. TMB]
MSLAMPPHRLPVRRSTRLATGDQLLSAGDSTPRSARRLRGPVDTTPPRNHTSHAKEQRRPLPAVSKRKSPEDDKRAVKKRKENSVSVLAHIFGLQLTVGEDSFDYSSQSIDQQVCDSLGTVSLPFSEKTSTIRVQSVPIAPVDDLPVAVLSIDDSAHHENTADVPTTCQTQQDAPDVDMLPPPTLDPETPPAQEMEAQQPSYVIYTDLAPGPSSPPASTSELAPISPPRELESENRPLLTPSALSDFDMAPVPSTSTPPSPLQTQPTPDVTMLSAKEQWQREYEEMERQRKRASQRQDRLWLSWAGGRVAMFIQQYGIEEVRARVRAEWARVAAAEGSPSPKARPSGSGSEGPAFEMYTPGTHGADDAEDFEFELDEYDEDEDDEGSVEDIVPEPNFEFLPPTSPTYSHPDASCSRGSASPAPPSQHTPRRQRREPVRGTPPFLERRQAWGGKDLVVRSLLPAAALQRARPPPPTRYVAPAPKQEAGLRLTYPGESMEEHHHPSPAPVLLPAPEPETCAAPAPDPTENFADPAIMQAIIASMNPPPPTDFAPSAPFTNGWSGAVSAPSSPASDWNFTGLGAGMGMNGVVGMGMEAGWYSSSSTLHSALG